MNTSVESELKIIQAKILAELDDDRKEVAARNERIKKNEALLSAINNSLGEPTSIGGGYGNKREMVRNAIQRITKARFTQTDVLDEIKRIDPATKITKDQVRNAMWTFSQTPQFIKKVSSGNNQQLALFEKAQANGTTNGSHTEAEMRRFEQKAMTLQSEVTPMAVEDRVRKASCRINVLAKDLNASEVDVLRCLEPNSKAYMAERGWIKIRE